jgi:hypothetical protein
MRSLLLLALLVASTSGCCCPPQDRCTQASWAALPALADPACRGCYTPGYQRPCFPAYRPIDSVSSR